jgi:hypothetical protein
MCVAWFPAPADSAACKRRHEFCVELSSGISQAIVSGWRLVVLEIPLHRKFEFLLSVPLILEYEAVLTQPQHLAACGLSGAETGRAIVTFNQRLCSCHKGFDCALILPATVLQQIRIGV